MFRLRTFLFRTLSGFANRLDRLSQKVRPSLEDRITNSLVEAYREASKYPNDSTSDFDRPRILVQYGAGSK